MSTTTNTPPVTDPWQAKELGVLWARVKKGTTEKYLTGTISIKKLIEKGVDPNADIPLIIFQNKRKKQDSHPDLRIYVSEDRNAAARPAAAAAQPQAKPATPRPAAATAAPKAAAPAATGDNELI
jgi:hypothetical protein